MIDFNSESVFKLRPVKIDGVSKTFDMMLIDGEEIFAAFQTVRDTVVFTNLRVIACNVQGVTGKKRDYTSMPFSKVQTFSIETSGTFDLDCELDLWFSAVGLVRFEISGNFDIRRFNQAVSSCIL